MSRISGWIDPELRAALDAIFAKLASPGAPSQDQTSGDTRSAAQRTHDAVKAVCRAMLSSGQLGQHNGLPVTIVATTTLADVTAAAGLAHTGGGTRLPIPTLFRMAAEVHPYLVLLRNPREIELYYGRTRRTVDAPSPAARRPPTTVRSTTPSATGSTAETPTSLSSLWPAGATTGWSTGPRTDGAPESARATTELSGYRRRTSTAGRPASMTITTPKRYCCAIRGPRRTIPGSARLPTPQRTESAARSCRRTPSGPAPDRR